jgi:hypothetical protein
MQLKEEKEREAGNFIDSFQTSLFLSIFFQTILNNKGEYLMV